MVSISLCMIVKDEEEVLARCLDSVQDIADEIVIVDTGSADRTREIASRYTDLVYDFVWIDDFAAARNFAFSRGTKDYLMWLDADDVISEKDRRDFLDLKRDLDPAVDIVMMKYHTGFDDMGNPNFSYYRERLIKNHKGYLWVSPIHEAITPSGNIIYSETGIEHRKIKASDPDRNLRIFEKMIHEGIPLDPRQQFYYAGELYYHRRYEEAKENYEVFLESEDGWLENQIEACRHLADCYHHMGQEKQELQALFYSLSLDIPRAEICCDIGRCFFDKKKYPIAVFWYKQAANTKRRDERGGFVLLDCYDYIPYLQLCVCYDRLGDYKAAQMYNEMAGKVRPDSKTYLANREYFLRRLGVH